MRHILVVAALLTATAASAQAIPEGAEAVEALAKLKAADANKDGKWDKPEWLAAGRREMGFTFIDADKDGFVTQDELKAGMEKMRALRGS
jgi:hypothetical protein